MSERVKKLPAKNRSAAKIPLVGQLFHTGGLDVLFCCLIMILFAFGITMMYSAGYAYASAYTSSPNSFFKSQLLSGAIGFAMMFFISKIDYRILNGILTPLAFAATVALLVYTYVANIHNDIKRWIVIGSRQFQPSEISKFVLVLVMAYLICIFYKPLYAEGGKRAMPSVKRLTKLERVVFSFFDTNFKCTVALAAVVVLFCGLVFIESHLSCTILLFCMGVSMMWLGGVKKKWFILLGAGAALVIVYVVFINPEFVKSFSNYAYERIMTWKTGESYGNTTRWQTEQGLLAIGSGGPFGVGFGNSKQKQLYIPEPQNDFIFAVICEELGFFGAALVVLLFAALICRGFIIATKTKDLFGALLVSGIMMQLGFQVILNIAVVTDTIPNTGIALPFFSYGGTALIILFCEMGVVLSVSRTCRLEKV